jgi:hypothetical protein
MTIQEQAEQLLDRLRTSRFNGGTISDSVGLITTALTACIEEDAKVVKICDCEITLDQDGLEHILGEIAAAIRRRKG